LAGQVGERLLELIEPVFDVDRVSPALRRGRRGQGEGNKEDEPGREELHGQALFTSNAAIFRHGRPVSK
jgi:hypothetical protein